MADEPSGMYVRELPPEERPRERLKKVGAENLKSSELLAILFRTGSRTLGAQDLARKVLAEFGDLRKLAKASIEELCEIKGVGEVKAIEIKAALELGRRLAAFTEAERPVIRNANDVSSLLMSECKVLDEEHFRVLLLTTKNQLIRVEEISVGSLDNSVVHPRECFRPAIAASAAAVILIHNHPSGDPKPSKEDVAITRRLVQAGELLGINVLDHVVFGDGTIVSLKERGLM